MKLFRNNKKSLVAIEKESFKMEKDIQSLVESNMDILFKLEFVSSEFSVAEFRLDSLAFDAETNAFVIVEYKKGRSPSAVGQGLAYLSLMVNNKANFILEYNKKKVKKLKEEDIDWDSSRLIFVSPEFNKYQKHSVNFKNTPLELWEIRKFNGGLVALEQRKSSSNESVPQSSKKDGSKYSSSVISKAPSEVKIFTEEDHVDRIDAPLKAVWATLKEKLEDYSGTSFAPTKQYISWRRGSTIVCYIHFLRTTLRIDVLQGSKKVSGEPSKGFFNLDAPKSIAKEKPWTLKSGQTGHVYSIPLRKIEQLDYVMFLLEQKYNSLG